MSTQMQAVAGAANVPGDILEPRQTPGFRMQHSLLKGFYLQDLLIEPASGRVSGPGIETHLKPKAVEVLLYLAERPFELVARDELLRAVWGDDAGSSEALTHAVSELRSCCNDHASSPTVIQTVPRRGYRLIQQPRLVDDPETLAETGVMQVPDDGSFIGNLMRRGVVQAAAAYLVFSWLLIQVADILTPTLNLPVWVPTLVTFASIGGFPIVIVLAWMLERSEGRWLLDRGRQSGKMLSGLERNYLSIILAYGIAAVGSLAYQFTVGFDVPGSTEGVVAQEDALLPVNPNSIAVLKFLNIGDNESGRIFSEGLGEDILDRLARIPGLAVSSRGDSWSLPQNASSDIVRKRLRVAYFLEGSVRVIGDELRVVVQLIESASGFHVFSRSFETELTDHMDVQREITNLAVANLRVALPEDRHADILVIDEEPNLDAYILFRRGKAVMDQPLTTESIEEAVGYFQRALEIDNDYSAAHAGVCDAYVALYQLTRDATNTEIAERACGQALRSNPNLDVVYTSLGDLRLVAGGDIEAAARAYQMALDMNPKDVGAMRGMAAVLQRQQKFDEAEAMLLAAIELQPGNWNNIDALGAHYFGTGQYSDAVEAYRQVVFLDPANWRGLGNLGTALMLVGDFDAAAGPLEESLSIEEDVDYLSNLGVIYYYLGDFDRAVEMHRKALSEMPRSVSAWLNLGDALRFSSHPDDAAGAYREANLLAAEEITVAPNAADSLYLRAWALASLGKQEEASTLIRQALSIAPRDPYADYFDALIKIAGGDQLGALDALQRAVDNGYPTVMLAADPLLSELRYEQKFTNLLNR
jgi:tetratricopeptide (TPR) repeat protein/DNA-binding winged helix-turn-helix (wHTH) protein